MPAKLKSSVYVSYAKTGSCAFTPSVSAREVSVQTGLHLGGYGVRFHTKLPARPWTAEG
jgi:hypothetical protein